MVACITAHLAPIIHLDSDGKEDRIMCRTSLVTCLLIAFIASPTSAVSEVPVDFRAAVLELMELTGASKLGMQMASGLSQQVSIQLQKANPNVPPRAFEIVNEVIASFFRDSQGDLIEETVRIYAKYFTVQDIRGIIAFNRTPLGKKMISVMPAITKESIQLGVALHRRLQPAINAEIKKRLTEEGLLQQ